MCGIAGFVDISKKIPKEDLTTVARKMTDALVHRGPDDCGAWVDEKVGIALGHRRLSIIDLSPQGHQPMVSSSGRYVIVFNGEIYNFQELRKELDASRHSPTTIHHSPSVGWRGHSDTEVMLAAFEQWGVENAVKRFTGMFAFALWDREERTLYLVRDRIGEKPLYYGIAGKTLLFASELKALLRHPDFRPEIDRGSLALYLRYKCIPAPHSIYRGIRKLLPGTILTIRVGELLSGKELNEPEPYWSVRDIAMKGVSEPFDGTTQEAADHLEHLLRETIRRQMVADVPVGVFLSGGIDSSTVTALMQAESSRPVKSFTIGYREGVFSEAGYARAVARHLQTDHTELCVTPQDAVDAVPLMPSVYDEPFSDDSQIPTFLLSRLTRRHVTVSLSGDGGDELFAGYNRHFRGRRLWNVMRLTPAGLRARIGHLILSVPPHRWDQAMVPFQLFLPARYRERLPGERLHKLAGVIASRSQEEMYLGLQSHWTDPESIVKGIEGTVNAANNGDAHCFRDFIHEMLLHDLMSYLPDDILVKVDRAGMAVSLETRMPYLDHRVVEFAWMIPLSMKIRNGRGKWILRQLLKRYVPEHLFERAKMGFGMPLSVWLRGPLREWAEGLLNERRLLEEGFFNPAPIRKKWEEHISCRFNRQYHLWDVLMFQSWLETQKRPTEATWRSLNNAR
ncbi:MAG: asparagine synthase (glutamine-hydrolyzing) [bacterium]